MKGGAREGAGRRAGKFGLKQTLTIRLSSDAIAFLDSIDDSRSEHIEHVIRNTIKFIEWNRKQNEDDPKPATG